MAPCTLCFAVTAQSLCCKKDGLLIKADHAYCFNCVPQLISYAKSDVARLGGVVRCRMSETRGPGRCEAPPFSLDSLRFAVRAASKLTDEERAAARSELDDLAFYPTLQEARRQARAEGALEARLNAPGLFRSNIARLLDACTKGSCPGCGVPGRAARCPTTLRMRARGATLARSTLGLTRKRYALLLTA